MMNDTLENDVMCLTLVTKYQIKKGQVPILPIACLNDTISKKMTAVISAHQMKHHLDLTGVIYPQVKDTVITAAVRNRHEQKEDLLKL